MAGKRRAQWRAVVEARDPCTGRVVSENTILLAGIEMTLELWNGDTSENFDRLRLEDANKDGIALESASVSYQVDTVDGSPLGIFTSTAQFSASDVSSKPDYVSLIGSNGTIIGRAALDLNADTPYEVKRKDYLGEQSDLLVDS